ncbi:MAG: DedA family protein [Bacteroidetes bacterium]|nr:DedA family protein [Bacteroidota bacterium]MDA1334154.1 DedA family protein [Bacteroidota bacterium]
MSNTPGGTLMGDMLLDIVAWMSSLSPMWAYSIILCVAWLENVVPPIPGDMVVVFGGYMAGLTLLSPWLVIVLATVGGTLGFMSMYAIGFRVGVGLLDPDRFRWLPKKRIRVVQEKLNEQGFALVAANRFLSGLRSVISLTVGMAHMDTSRTWFWSSISSLAWCALLTGAGVVVGENWEIVSGYLQAWGGLIMTVIVIFVLLQLIRHRRSQKKQQD